MRIHHLLLLTLLSFAACTKHDVTPGTPITIPLIYKDTAAIPPFLSTPLAANQLQLTFPWGSSIAKVYLKNDTGVLGVFPTTAQPQFSTTANITYNFEAGRKYSFIAESAPAKGIALRYTLRNYTHTYTAPFVYQQLLTMTQSLGPNFFDISPSRKYLFVTDDVNNSLITKQLSLTDGSVSIVPNIPYGYIRAVSDNELLITGSSYNGHVYSGDTAALLRYNITTKQSSLVALVSVNYGRISRIIDNHVLLTQPVFPGYSMLVNLTDTSKIIYPYPAVNFVFIGQYNFDHLYYYNQVVNPVTGAFQSILPATDSAGIEVIDNASGYTITSWYSELLPGPISPTGYYKSHLGAYLNGNLVYKTPDSTTLSYQIPRQPAITNNKLLVYQEYGWDTAFHISGYYQVDLNAKTKTLLQCYSTSYFIEDFQLDAHNMISVRADGIYKVTLP